MTSAAFLWFSICVMNIFMTKMILHLMNVERTSPSKSSPNEINNTIKMCLFYLENSFSFVEVVDSKMIGLFIFLISNVFTGLINLSFKTREMSDLFALIILGLNSFISTLIPFIFYYFYFIKNKRINK